MAQASWITRSLLKVGYIVDASEGTQQALREAS